MKLFIQDSLAHTIYRVENRDARAEELWEVFKEEQGMETNEYKYPYLHGLCQGLLGECLYDLKAALEQINKDHPEKEE
jgi:hypothetical protein